MARVKNNCSKELVKPLKKVKIENHSTVSCSTRTRPYLSDSTPPAHPPIADVMSAPVAM